MTIDIIYYIVPLSGNGNQMLKAVFLPGFISRENSYYNLFYLLIQQKRIQLGHCKHCQCKLPVHNRPISWLSVAWRWAHHHSDHWIYQLEMLLYLLLHPSTRTKLCSFKVVWNMFKLQCEMKVHLIISHSEFIQFFTIVHFLSKKKIFHYSGRII